MPVHLPVLTESARQVLQYPPAPADPPSPSDVSKACSLSYTALKYASESEYAVTSNDVCNTATYAVQTIAARVGFPQMNVEEAVVAAVQAAMQPLHQQLNEIGLQFNQRLNEVEQQLNQRLNAMDQQLNQRLNAMDQQLNGMDQRLNGRLNELQGELRRNRRVTALMWNRNEPHTAVAHYEVVPFPGGDDPTEAPVSSRPMLKLVSSLAIWYSSIICLLWTRRMRYGN
ncbi:hypothetical protein GLOTRDRAFT_123727 [Gloeophyllum trabeum ATCC 11539]|uniref:Uncharacterized protein n=1 Tax=Gloeophyllum trabeum (strain ATCC 11539 / FP-39264 / Madison 617) TaxID=670483 RepID=S7RYF0_GLOTA|nr:uncharacterized protein GLOTRDRAFT_123727 [Gloeophyllum trabeum ATCC 11539]EPQ59970.1 hypothetical protein GLOTRDRAFT_123727 [Gloeophyllum trabeum ATCC 11539]